MKQSKNTPVMRTAHLEHDLFLLMLNLSQLKDSERICQLFLDALNTCWDAISLRLTTDETELPEHTEKIATASHSFGYLVLEGNLAALGQDERALIRNSTRMLALILENRLQENLLSEENLRLEQLVQARTAELSTINAQLHHEILERQQAEEQLTRYQEHLEELVTQRTLKFEAANQDLKDFAYIVSHDLKAPLRGINQLASWLVQDYEQVVDQEGKEMIALLMNRVKRLDLLIDGILQYSRIGRFEGEGEQIDLNRLIPELIDALAPPPHIKISWAPRFPVIEGNRIRIEQLFQNLISNAIKFLDKPEGLISLYYEEHEAFWIFSVADNGPGIALKYHEKIFQIFQTLQARDEMENTGIGLALVKKIVELHGGKIWLESQPGEGSTFLFTLPKRWNAK